MTGVQTCALPIFEVDRLFTDRYTFDQADEAYQAFDKQAAGKGVFVN